MLKTNVRININKLNILLQQCYSSHLNTHQDIKNKKGEYICYPKFSKDNSKTIADYLFLLEHQWTFVDDWYDQLQHHLALV